MADLREYRAKMDEIDDEILALFQKRMKKFWILTFMTLFMALPAMSMEQPDDVIEDEMQSVSITIKEGSVKVTNAQGQKLEIFNLAGVRISSLALESEETTLKLNLSRGCYILKVGKTVRKVNVK